MQQLQDRKKLNEQEDLMQSDSEDSDGFGFGKDDSDKEIHEDQNAN